MKQIWIYVKRNLVYPRVCLDSKSCSYIFVCSFDIIIPDNAHYITDEYIRTQICCASINTLVYFALILFSQCWISRRNKIR